jgi:hypothetical protein
MTDGWREGPILEDKGSVKLETLLGKFFAALYKAVMKQWREARRAKIREAEERLGELGRAGAARILEEAEQRAAAERRLRDALSTEARNWEEAQRIRAYVQWVQGTVGEARTLSLAGIGGIGGDLG